MRSTILIAFAFAASMLVRSPAYAFQTEADKSDPISSAQLSDPKTLNDFGNLQGLGPSTPNHFSDSDSDPPGSIKLLGGSLQIIFSLNQRTEKAGNKNGNVNIPGSLP